MKVTSAVSIAVVLVVGSSILAVAGSPLFPLETGWTWMYVGDQGGAAQVDIGATQVVIGTETTVRHIVIQSVSGSQSYENYWTASAAGDVLVHGFTNHTEGFVLSYDPPILWLDAPLEVGKTWSTTTQAYNDLDGTVPSGAPFTIKFAVLSEEDLAVPAGTFHVYGIGQVLPAPVASGSQLFDPLGCRLSSSGRVDDVSDWISPGVGLVRWGVVEHFDLTTYGPPLPVAPQSWAGLKAVYR